MLERIISRISGLTALSERKASALVNEEEHGLASAAIALDYESKILEMRENMRKKFLTPLKGNIRRLYRRGYIDHADYMLIISLVE